MKNVIQYLLGKDIWHIFFEQDEYRAALDFNLPRSRIGLSFLLIHLNEWSQQQEMWAFLTGEVQEGI